MSELSRAATIAVQARRFRLLSERPHLLYSEPSERAERTLADPRPMFDALLIAGVDETDRVCGAAVAMIRQRVGKAVAPLLELFGVLPGDYLLAIYYALPEERRAVCERDEVWAYRLRNAPPGIGAALGDVEALADSGLAFDGLPFADTIEAERFSAGLVRRRLGLDHDLTPEQERIAEAGEAALRTLSDEPGETCPTCGERIPREEFRKHLSGLDTSRIECERQDIGKIKRAEQAGDLPAARLNDAW